MSGLVIVDVVFMFYRSLLVVCNDNNRIMSFLSHLKWAQAIYCKYM